MVVNLYHLTSPEAIADEALTPGDVRVPRSCAAGGVGRLERIVKDRLFQTCSACAAVPSSNPSKNSKSRVSPEAIVSPSSVPKMFTFPGVRLNEVT